MNLNPLIVIDARCISPEGHGFGRYVTGLAEAIDAASAPESALSFRAVFLVSRGARLPLVFDRLDRIECDSRFLSLHEWLEIPAILKKTGASLYHSPTFASIPTALMPCPWIVTVHDLNHRQFGGFKERLYYSLILRPFCQKALAVSSVSAFAASELSEWLDCPPQRITLVPNAVDSELASRPRVDPSSAVLAKLGLERDAYMICLSGPKEHKNLDTVLAAIECVLEGGAPQDLRTRWVFTAPREALLHVMKRVGATRLATSGQWVCTGGITKDEDLWDLISGARRVLAPSRYEGLGLVPIEAIALGTRVIASDIPAHREGLASLAAVDLKSDAMVEWVPALSIAGWAEAMQRANRATPGPQDGDSGEQTQKNAQRRAIVAQHSADQRNQALIGFYRASSGATTS